MNEHESPLKIGALAQASGISARMLRFYEKIGLLMPVRNAAGYRLYQAADVDLVRKVRLLNQAGPDLRRRLLAQQVAIARQIIELQQSGDLLAALLEK